MIEFPEFNQMVGLDKLNSLDQQYSNESMKEYLNN